MSKEYRDRKRRTGVQAQHKGRHVHALDNVLPLDKLMEEVILYDCIQQD